MLNVLLQGRPFLGFEEAFKEGRDIFGGKFSILFLKDFLKLDNVIFFGHSWVMGSP